MQQVQDGKLLTATLVILSMLPKVHSTIWGGVSGASAPGANSEGAPKWQPPGSSSPCAGRWDVKSLCHIQSSPMWRGRVLPPLCPSPATVQIRCLECPYSAWSRFSDTKIKMGPLNHQGWGAGRPTGSPGSSHTLVHPLWTSGFFFALLLSQALPWLVQSLTILPVYSAGLFSVLQEQRQGRYLY